MAKPDKITKRDQDGHLAPRQFDDIFENFRREIESVMKPWSSEFWGFPSRFSEEVRVPLCDMTDRGDRYELQVEVPGIEKDKIDVKATGNSVEISGEHSEKAEEKGTDHIYSERSHRSFYRRIPVPGEIVPSKISTKMNNGILSIGLPKKMPQPKKQAKRVEIK